MVNEKDFSKFQDGELVKVSGGATSAASQKRYLCPKCGWGFCYPTGEGVNIGSHSYYPEGLWWYYECTSCKKSFLECELDGTIPPWDGVSKKGE